MAIRGLAGVYPPEAVLLVIGTGESGFQATTRDSTKSGTNTNISQGA